MGGFPVCKVIDAEGARAPGSMTLKSNTTEALYYIKPFRSVVFLFPHYVRLTLLLSAFHLRNCIVMRSSAFHTVELHWHT